MTGMARQMKAAVFDSPFALSLFDKAAPEPGPGEALVEVSAAGLCAGDLYIYLGKNPYVTYPRIGGHEIAGRVARLAADAKGPPPGTRVVVDPFIGCGHCYPCRIGKRNCCANLRIIGVHREGGFAEYVAAPASQLHVVPDSVSDFEASFAEPVAIGVQACRRGAVESGDTVLVLGAGPIGLAIIEVARARGGVCYVSDPNHDRLATAQSLGATALPSGDALSPAVLEATNGEGMPVVMEATGVAKVMEQTIDLVASGGRIVIVGLLAKGAGVTLPGLDLTRKEATILGSRASVDCFPEALRLLAGGHIHYAKMATRFGLEEAPAVFKRLSVDPGSLHKAVFMGRSAIEASGGADRAIVLKQ
jgi:L-gulonate 5-dehydrogenase